MFPHTPGVEQAWICPSLHQTPHYNRQNWPFAGLLTAQNDKGLPGVPVGGVRAILAGKRPLLACENGMPSALSAAGGMFGGNIAAELLINYYISISYDCFSVAPITSRQIKGLRSP
jgi:hypothetical protein